MDLKEAKSDMSTQEIGDAIEINADGNESVVADAESLSEGELSDLLKQIEELDSEEVSKEELDSEPEDSEEDVDSRGTRASKTALAMLASVNSVRRKYGRPPLRFDTRLTAAAQLHSRDMARHQRVTHKGSNGSSFAQRIRQQGYSGAMAENVGAGPNVKNLMRRWMNSPGHRKNILNPRYRDFGIGYVKGGRTWYWTQTFGG